MDKYQLEKKRKKLNSNKKREKLQKLYQMLTYESSAIITMAMIPIVGFVVLSVILTIAIIIFVPIMIRTLWQLEKRGWIVALVLLNAVPYIISLIFASNMLINTIFSSIGMFNFFAYCWVLKFSVKKWLDEFIADDFEAENEFEFNDSGY